MLQYMHHCFVVVCVVSDVVMISLRMNKHAFAHDFICVPQRLRFKQINVSVMRAVCCRYVNDVLF